VAPKTVYSSSSSDNEELLGAVLLRAYCNKK